MGTRAAVYCRISEDRTGQAAGVDRQQQDATQLAERRGWTVVATLIDNDLSASRYAKRPRPAYEELLGLIETGQIDAVVVWHTDRLHRQPKELEHLIDLVEKHGVKVATCHGDYDLEDGDGRAMARMLATWAAKESDDKSRRIKRKHQEIAASGGYNGGKRPFGFERDGVTVREGEAELIRDAAARVVAGESLRSIARHWTDLGVSTVMGGPWQATTVRRILLSPRLAGLRTHHGATVKAVWPAIIDERTHKRLHAVLSDPQRNKVAGVTARTYLLTGLVYCGRCDVRMVPHRGRYQCDRDRGGCNGCGISARLDEDVTAAVVHRASQARVRKHLLARANEGNEATLLDDVAATEAEITLLAKDYAAKRIGRDGYLAAVGALEQRLDDLRRQLSRHLAKVEAVTLADDPSQAWGEVGFDRQRATIGQMIRKITVEPSYRRAGVYDYERVQITWA